MTFSIWWHLFALLTVEAGVLVTIAMGLVRRAKSAAWQRTIWQTAQVALLLLFLCEAAGLSGAAAGLIAIKQKPRPPLIVAIQVSRVDRLPRQLITTTPQTARPLIEKLPPAPLRSWWPGVIWLLGVACVLARTALGRITFLLCRKLRQPVKNEDLQLRVRTLAARLGFRRLIRVTQSSRLKGPVAFGIAFPSICLPADFSRRFTTAQQDAMLTHEIAHLCAHDPAWYCLADLVFAFWWWHPVVWWSRRRLHSASEQAADEACLVVDDGPDALAESLVELAKRFARPRSFGWIGIEGDGFGSVLRRRIERLYNLDGNWHPLGAGSRLVAHAIGLLALLLVIVCMARGSSQDIERPDASKAFRHSVAGAAWNGLVERASMLVATVRQADLQTNPFLAAAALKRAGEVGPARLEVPPTSLASAAQINGTSQKQAAGEGPPLYWRTFKLDPNTLVQGLDQLVRSHLNAEERREIDSGANSDSVLRVLRLFQALLLHAGVNVDSPPAIFFNQRSGRLMIRATLEDLDVAETVISLLNVSPPQLKLEFRLVEVPEDSKTGFDLLALLGISQAGAYTLPAMERGSAQKGVQGQGPSGKFPGLPPTDDSILLRWVITPSQFDLVFKALAERGDAQIISLTSITTLSDRPAQLRAAAPEPSGHTNDADLPLPLDIVPSVQADHYTIRMTLTPTIKEFIGYDLDALAPPQAVGGMPQVGKVEALTQLPSTSAPSAAGLPSPLPSAEIGAPANKPTPVFRVRSVATSAVLWDGQTVVVGGLRAGSEANRDQKIPILGDLPVTGRLFRTNRGPKRKSFLLFVTPRIIDPAGNPVHTPGDLPFAETNVPPQR